MRYRRGRTGCSLIALDFTYGTKNTKFRKSLVGVSCNLKVLNEGGLFRFVLISSVCFGCFDTGSKHRNKPKFFFWFHATNRNKRETDLVSVCFGSNRIFFFSFQGHPRWNTVHYSVHCTVYNHRFAFGYCFHQLPPSRRFTLLRDGILKLGRSPEIDSKESILPA